MTRLRCLQASVSTLSILALALALFLSKSAYAQTLDWWVVEHDAEELQRALADLWPEFPITVQIGIPGDDDEGLRYDDGQLVLLIQGAIVHQTDVADVAKQVVLARSWVLEAELAGAPWVPAVVVAPRPEPPPPESTERIRQRTVFFSSWSGPGIRTSGQFMGETGIHLGIGHPRIGYGLILATDYLEFPRISDKRALVTRIGGQLAISFYRKTETTLGVWGIEGIAAIGVRGAVMVVPEHTELTWDDSLVPPAFSSTTIAASVNSGAMGYMTLAWHVWTPRAKPFPLQLGVGMRMDLDFANLYNAVNHSQNQQDSNSSPVALHLDVAIMFGTPWIIRKRNLPG
ncbi:MAG: hypothetical protein HN348_17520 [Proteobacteria bacterium]|nr:hypothetical protein [Pseudomonadota bacterium]